MTTLLDLVRDVSDSLYGYVQVKDAYRYLASDITDSATSMPVGDARGLHAGQILELTTDDTVVSEQVRVRSVNPSTNTLTVVRAVRGTTAAAWASATAQVRVEPEYPVASVVREINKEIVGLPPQIWAIATETTTVDDAWRVGYQLPVGAIGVISVRYQPVGYDGDAWLEPRRWDYDAVNRILTVKQLMDPGAPLKITYRAYPTEIAADADTLVSAGLDDQLGELVTLGATYRLLAKRAPARLIDTAAQTPLNGQYRQADPVNAAVRQLYAMYQERLMSEQKRQLTLYPVKTHFTV